MKRLANVFWLLMMFWRLAESQIGTLDPIAPEVWSEPVKLGVLNQYEWGWAFEPSINLSGDTLYFVTGGGINYSVGHDTSWSRPIVLNNNVNFTDVIHRPSISPDGRKLYFDVYGYGYGSWDIWVSEWNDSLKDWGPAKNLGPNINTDEVEDFAFTPDNKHLYFVRMPFGSNILVSYWNDTLKGWGSPRLLNEYLNGGATVNGLSLPADSRKIYFTKMTYGGKHAEFEMCVAYRDSITGTYKNPMRLNINSHPPDSVPWYNPAEMGNDSYPSVTGDGKYLFFESNREMRRQPSGVYQPDIYVSRLLIDEHGDTVTAVNKPTRKKYPQSFQLYQNYPNPFNPTTIVSFKLERTAIVTVKIYDTLGREVRLLLDEKCSPDEYKIVWDGRDSQGKPVSSGAYYYQVSVSGQVQTQKMLLIH